MKVGKVDQAARVELASISAGLKKKGDIITNDRRYTDVPKATKKEYADKLKSLLLRYQDLHTQVDKGKGANLSKADQRRITDGEQYFAALESACSAVENWRTFAKQNWAMMVRQTGGILSSRNSDRSRTPLSPGKMRWLNLRQNANSLPMVLQS